ncbi:tetratricopeptide repeat protein [bacterium]|nr:tetratricopeptide repeat protein [bacterium]
MEDPAAAARELFERTVKEYHLPSAEKQGAEKDRLFEAAVQGYQEVLDRYPGQSYYCAQALRSLGNVRAEQGRLDEAVTLYQQVGVAYPRHDWEVLQAWKSAGDLLAEAARATEAREFYQRIVDRFDQPDTAPVVRTVVKAAKRRLGVDTVVE